MKKVHLYEHRKRVWDAIDKMEAFAPEGVLFAICAALKATAVKEFGPKGRSSSKNFIVQNRGLIPAIAWGGCRLLSFRLEFDHPELQKNADDVSPIEEIFYHAVRCGL